MGILIILDRRVGRWGTWIRGVDEAVAVDARCLTAIGG